MSSDTGVYTFKTEFVCGADGILKLFKYPILKMDGSKV